MQKIRVAKIFADKAKPGVILGRKAMGPAFGRIARLPKQNFYKVGGV